MGALIYASVYFGLGLWLGLSKTGLMRVLLAALALLVIGAASLGAMSEGGTGVFSRVVMMFGPVLGFAIALGRVIRQMRRRP